MMGFDVDKMAHKITSPFEHKLEAVAERIDQSNEQLAELLKLTKTQVDQQNKIIKLLESQK